MFKQGAKLFVQFKNETKSRLLHAAEFVQDEDEVFVVGLKLTSDQTLETGDAFFIYFEQRREFMQQAVQFVSYVKFDELSMCGNCDNELCESRFEGLDVFKADCEIRAGELIRIRLIGQPVSAEHRKRYRVSAANSERFGYIAGERCPLMDVSLTGFSVISEQIYEPGEQLCAGLDWESIEYGGEVTVQNVKRLDGKRIRYGVHCVEDRQLSGDLLKGLQHLSMAIQQEQLQRQAYV